MVSIIELVKNQYFVSLLILVGSIIIANIVHIILKIYAKRLTLKTKNDVDDILLKIIIRPLYLLMIFIGIYLSLIYLTIFNKYELIIKKVFFVIFVLIISYVISRILSLFVIKWLKVQKKYERTPQLLNRFISIIVYVIAILTILAYFKVEITPLIATLGIGGIAIGLALQNTLTNFFAGLHIISDKPIRVGDFIELDGGVAGYVEDIGWRSTRIKTLPNTIIIVPNLKLSESIITNNSLPEQEIAALVQCGVSYDSDLKKVEKVTIDVAKKIQKTVPGAIKNFEPFIRYNSFGDSNINFTIILRAEKFVDRFLIIHEFIKALKERYDKENIEISWPVRKIYYGKQSKEL